MEDCIRRENPVAESSCCWWENQDFVWGSVRSPGPLQHSLVQTHSRSRHPVFAVGDVRRYGPYVFHPKTAVEVQPCATVRFTKINVIGVHDGRLCFLLAEHLGPYLFLDSAACRVILKTQFVREIPAQKKPSSGRWKSDEISVHRGLIVVSAK